MDREEKQDMQYVGGIVTESHKRTLQMATRIEKVEDKRKEIRKVFELMMKPIGKKTGEEKIYKDIYEL